MESFIINKYLKEDQDEQGNSGHVLANKRNSDFETIRNRSEKYRKR